MTSSSATAARGGDYEQKSSAGSSLPGRYPLAGGGCPSLSVHRGAGISLPEVWACPPLPHPRATEFPLLEVWACPPTTLLLPKQRGAGGSLPWAWGCPPNSLPILSQP